MNYLFQPYELWWWIVVAVIAAILWAIFDAKKEKKDD